MTRTARTVIAVSAAAVLGTALLAGCSSSSGSTESASAAASAAASGAQMLPPIFIQPTDTAVSCKVGDNLNFVIDDKNLAGTTVSTDNKDIVELTQAGEKDGATYTAGGKCLAAGTATITVTAPDNTKRDIALTVTE